MKLSKSLYTRGLQCQKSLWLKKNKKALLEYCKLDTLAMVRVLGKLKECVR